MAIIIVQQPDTLSLSGNLKDLVVQTDSALQVTLSTGSDTVLDETYYPGNGNLVHLNFSDVINAYLAYSLPNTDIYLQTKLSAAFTVSLTNHTDNKTLSFSAIKGGKLHLNESASQFLKGNFLTWQPIQKQVTYYSPEWLTYYAPSACSIMLKAYWEDGSTSTKTLVSPSAGYCYTVNLQYAVVSGMFDGKRPMYYDVWVESGGARLTYVQRYVASELQADNEHWFLFENSLGGMDSVRAYGSQTDDPEYDYHLALRGNEGENYRIDVERVRSVNTGYLTPEETRWLQDLFATRKAYVYTATGLYPIILTACEGATEGDDEPSSFSFGYRFADVRPYLDIQRRTDLPENLTIPVPTGETFFLPPRLAEFPKQELSPDLLIPVEEPHTEAWGTLTAGMLYDSVLNALINALKGIDLNLIGNGGSDIEIIKQFDLTTPTDNNVFSSLRTLLEINKVSGDFNEALEDLMRRIMSMFLRKDIDDTAAGFITFLKGLRSADFTMGEFGNGFILKYENGESYFEIDRMLVRKAAYFVELIIKQLSHVGGQIVLTPASMRCSKVDEYLDFYRCYFENEKDCKKIEQEFKVGDQARCQTFNVEVGVNENVGNQYYWRLVTYVGENFIDLSKIDCDLGSTPPMEGDDIVLLGNRTDKTRQNAIILSSIGEDAPSFKQYEGIDSYSLAGKEVTVISPKGNKLKGDFLSTSGKDLSESLDDFRTRLDEIETQTDKSYTIWFEDYEPTLENNPAIQWIDDTLKREHLQDIFYNTNSGRAYRFTETEGVYGWEEITDAETIKALELAAKAQATADEVERELDEIVKDGILSSLEKKEVLKEWNEISSSFNNNVANASEYNVDYSRYEEAFIALGTYLNGGAYWDISLIPSWLSNLSVNQEIDPEVYRSKWVDYYYEENNLLRAISKAINKKAEDARDEADKIKDELDEIVSDGILSSLEKKEVLKEWEEVVSSYRLNIDNADDYKVNHSSYDTAFFELAKYLNGGVEWDEESTPLWLADLATNQKIDSNAYRSKWISYYDEEVKLLDSISRHLKDLTDTKIQIFVDKPQPPYKIGDKWMNASYTEGGVVLYDGDDLVCIKDKKEGESFDINDWDYELKKFRVQVESKIQNVRGTIELISTAFEVDENGHIKLDENGNPVLTSQAGAVIKSDMAKLYVTKDEMEASIGVDENGAYLKVVSEGKIISSINASKEDITIDAKKINLQGAVTFNSFSQELQKKIDSKVTTDDITAALTNYVTNTDLTNELKDYALASSLQGFVKSETLQDVLSNYTSNDTLDELKSALVNGNTTIIGGLLSTNLIDVDNLYATSLAAVRGTIGGFDINSGWLQCTSNVGDDIGYIDMQGTGTRIVFGRNVNNLMSKGKITASITNSQTNYWGIDVVKWSPDGEYNIGLSITSSNCDFPISIMAKGFNSFMGGLSVVTFMPKVFQGDGYEPYLRFRDINVLQPSSAAYIYLPNPERLGEIFGGRYLYNGEIDLTWQSVIKFTFILTATSADVYFRGLVESPIRAIGGSIMNASSYSSGEYIAKKGEVVTFYYYNRNYYITSSGLNN